jgi:hypothetical protein
MVESQPKRRQNGGGQGATRKTTPTALARRERDLRAVKLRGAGLGWQEIADQLSYADPGHAYRAFMKIMKEYPREDVETARETEADRYDSLQRAIWAQCLTPGNKQHWAIDRALRLMDQRARLLGLNAPLRQQIEVITESTVDKAIHELEALMEANESAAKAALAEAKVDSTV